MQEEEKKSGKISDKLKERRDHYKSKLIPFKEIFMAITVLMTVLAFFIVKSCSNSLSGVNEITIIDKFMEDQPYVVVDNNNISHYVDKESYKLAVPQGKYRIEQYEYTEHLRSIESEHFHF
jgi:hypothetical protein